MDSRESSTGRTKQAESCWRRRPAFISVGELGRKSSRVMQSYQRWAAWGSRLTLG